ncbi:hypothetical protein WICMUC_002257 [Wickerhamomyces mucosus]|uniref:FMR1-interacting protein 1 conserved domain-containing protein n=1 Tax=Wickerhamomyces mucosus TaxID=1378264 RepID=A0A9P8TEJ4_9ASCO|nr:hypothetical protein WICMUC_002257 [Wickerhamomyces mucosus]
MDYIYGKRTNTNNNINDEQDTKRLKINNYESQSSELPMWLPNTRSNDELNKSSSIDELNKSSISLIPNLNNFKEEPSNKDKSISLKPLPIIQGTNISLKTDQDIEDWIKQRKLNWMQKISNNRPKDDLQNIEKDNKFITRQQSNSIGNHRSHIETLQNKKKFKERIHNSINNTSNINLNNLILKRQMREENLKVLKFIKNLFETGILE